MGLLLANTPVDARELDPSRPPTPIETLQHARITRSVEMSHYMETLVKVDARASLEIVGHSVKNRPIEAMVFRTDAPADGRRLTMMLIGSVHGAAEPAGGEALLDLARDIVDGDLTPLRRDIDFVLIPNANPDGRDLGRRSNAKGININVDFVAMTQPETAALKHAIERFQPDILLDSHESAVYKRKTLATQNYMTNLWAQFESTNIPAMPAAAREFSYAFLLPDMIARTQEHGLPAQRYIGEITSIRQPITNGGYTLQNLRNAAGLSGALSFLVETRLDPRIDVFPTYRNIAERIARQKIVLRAFIQSAHAHRIGVGLHVDNLRTALAAEPVMMKAEYVLDANHPRVTLPMIRLDTRRTEKLTFPDHRHLVAADLTSMPTHLLITELIEELRPWLQRQGIEFEQRPAGQRFRVEWQRFRFGSDAHHGAELSSRRVETIELRKPALLVDLRQRQGRSAWLLLNPRSSTSLFRLEAHRARVAPERDFFVAPVVSVPD